MIPWTRFSNSPSEIYLPDLRYELRANILLHVDNGPTMSQWALDNSVSPMLESALERQFVVTQLGGTSNDFEDEHVDRINACLDMLHTKLQYSSSEDFVEQASPHSYDVIGLLHSVLSLNAIEELDLDMTPTQSPRISRRHICPIEIQGHDETESVTATPPTSRHHSIVGIPNLIHADSSPSPPSTIRELLGSTEDVPTETSIRSRVPYARANHHPPTQRSRSLKAIKIRRESKSRSRRRADSVLRGLKQDDKIP